MMEENTKTREPELRFWKSNSKNTGAALIFSFDSNKGSVYAKMMPQVGDKKFDSDKRITCKLGEADIGEMLTVLAGVKNGVGAFDENKKMFKGLYHTSPAGTTIIHFKTTDYGYSFNMMAERDKVQNSMNVTLNIGEVQLLRVFLLEAAKRMMFP